MAKPDKVPASVRTAGDQRATVCGAVEPRSSHAGQNPDDWLLAAGEAARRIRDFDWASTPLGPLHSWPASLRTCVNLILAHPVPLAVAWSDAFILIPNEPCRVVLAKVGADGVGRAAGDLWGDLRSSSFHQAVLQRGEAVEREQDLAGPSGEPHRFRLCCTPIRAEDGRVGGMLIAARELGAAAHWLEHDPARHAAELEIMQQRLHLAQRAGRVGVFDWNVLTGELACTEELEEILGLGCGDLGGTYEAWARIVEPEDLVRIEAILRDWLASDRPTAEWEYRVVRPDGQVRWIAARVTVTRDASGRPLRVIGSNLDITERKLDELQVRQSEERFRAVLEHSLDVAYRRNLQADRYDYMSPVARQVLGFSAEEMEGMSMREAMEQVHPEDRAGLELGLAGAIETGSGRLEYRWRRKDGEYRWIADHITVDSGCGAEPGYCTGIVRDVTEQKQTEQELEKASAAKDQFLAALSHELRTPLTPVLAAAGVMEQDSRLPADVREDAAMMRRNVMLETRLIDDLLDLTRISRGKFELDLHTVDLTVILRRAVEICSADVDARQLRLEIEMEPGPVPVIADPTRLHQVFWNLLKNAIKFSPEGGRIGIRCRARAGSCTVEVRDEGIGIDPAQLPRLFKPFEQGDRHITRQFGGLGLGLAICRAVVELHGGRIEGHSEGKGRGAAFTVELPVADVMLPLHEPLARPAASASPQRRLRILLVEDHPDTARLLGRLLRAAGHDVAVAGGVSAALALGEVHAFDVVVSDLGLPDGSGLELLPQLIAKQPAIVGVALSGYGTDEDVRTSYQAGFTSHLTKPVHIAQLYEAIDRAVAR